MPGQTGPDSKDGVMLHPDLAKFREEVANKQAEIQAQADGKGMFIIQFHAGRCFGGFMVQGDLKYAEPCVHANNRTGQNVWSYW